MINIPTKIEKIFDKPGNEWSEDDYNYIINWLFQDQQLKYLYGFALKKLGDGDAKDVLHDFIVETDIFNSIINSYNPVRGSRFWGYLLLCLRRRCVVEGIKIRERHNAETSLTIINDEEFIEFELEDSSASPEEALIYKELIEAIKVSKVLSPKEKTIFELRYIDNLLINEISEKLSISDSNVKTRLCGIKRKLQTFLPKRGWPNANKKS